MFGMNQIHKKCRDREARGRWVGPCEARLSRLVFERTRSIAAGKKKMGEGG